MYLYTSQTYELEETHLDIPQTYTWQTMLGKLKADKDEKLSDDGVPTHYTFIQYST